MKTSAILRIIVAIPIFTTAVAISTAAITKQYDAIDKCNFVVTN